MIQIFGTKKCKTTQKALRFFKERRIQVQFIDLNQRGMSKGELKKVCQVIPIEELIDTEGKEYEKQQLRYLHHDIAEKLLETPLLFRTPVLRNGQAAAVGCRPDRWTRWAADER